MKQDRGIAHTAQSRFLVAAILGYPATSLWTGFRHDLELQAAWSLPKKGGNAKHLSDAF